MTPDQQRRKALALSTASQAKAKQENAYPPLFEPYMREMNFFGGGWRELFTADQMRAYADAAIALNRPSRLDGFIEDVEASGKGS